MFRFTIRDLVLLTIIVAMGVAWWVDRSHLAVRLQTATDVADAAMKKTELLLYLQKHGRLPPE